MRNNLYILHELMKYIIYSYSNCLYYKIYLPHKKINLINEQLDKFIFKVTHYKLIMLKKKENIKL